VSQRRLRTAIVGIGAVGQEMLRVLRQRSFPASDLKVLARRPRDVTVDGEIYQVQQISAEAFAGVELALFAGAETPEGHLGWEAVKRGAIVIDNASAFRMYPNVPLVVPEVNAHALEKHEGLISNPNCSTIQMVVALKPLHDAARIKRICVSTYQAVSGKSADAVQQLEKEVEATGRGEPMPEPGGGFRHPIAGNVLPYDNVSWPLAADGYTAEELKMVRETRKILEDETMQITATCVRVPVRTGHGEAVNVEFHEPISAEEARAILSRAPGVVVQDDPQKEICPLPLDVEGTDEVYVGRIRQDRSVPYGLNIWVVADNLRKGAALNAVQIAERMMERGLL
jgi:aspartate-semialdehyde dehydrogenase